MASVPASSHSKLPAKRLMFFMNRDHALDNMKQRNRICKLCGDIDMLWAVFVFEKRHIWPHVGKAGIWRIVPLHRRADTITIVQPNVIAHTDFIAVINNGRTGQREEKRIG